MGTTEEQLPAVEVTEPEAANKASRDGATKAQLGIVTWKRLSHLGNIQFLRISYAVLVAVPLLVSISRTPMASFFGSVPLTMRLGYFASLLLSVAHMLYQGFCPEIIKRFESPNDLYRDMLEIKGLQSQYLANDYGFEFNIEHCRQGFIAANHSNLPARIACGILYALGLVIVAWIAVERSAVVLSGK